MRRIRRRPLKITGWPSWWRASGAEQGWESVQLRRYEVLHSSPRHVALEMIAPRRYRATLAEASYAVDPDTRNPALASTYFGYSASGEVTAELVYAHNGNPEDYELLRAARDQRPRQSGASSAIPTPTVIAVSRR